MSSWLFVTDVNINNALKLDALLSLCVRASMCVYLDACLPVGFIIPKIISPIPPQPPYAVHTHAHTCMLSDALCGRGGEHTCSTVTLCQHTCLYMFAFSPSVRMRTHTNPRAHTDVYTNCTEWLIGFAAFIAVTYKLFGCCWTNATWRRARQVVVESGTSHVSGPYLSFTTKWKHASTC